MTIDPNATIDEVAAMVMDLAFRFKNGQVVTFNSVPKAPKAGWFASQTQFFGTVTSRHLQQCHGGIQRQYVVNFHALTTRNTLSNEDELRPLNEHEQSLMDGEDTEPPPATLSDKAKLKMEKLAKETDREGETKPKDGSG